jgi:hypothetical protein
MCVRAASYNLGQGLATEPNAERFVTPDVLAVNSTEPQTQGQQDDEQDSQAEPPAMRSSHGVSLAQAQRFGNWPRHINE